MKTQTFTLTFEIGKSSRLSSVVIAADDWYAAALQGAAWLARLRYRGKKAALVGVGNGDYTQPFGLAEGVN